MTIPFFKDGYFSGWRGKIALAIIFSTVFAANLVLAINLNRQVVHSIQKERIFSQLPDYSVNNRNQPALTSPLVLGAVTPDVKLGDSRAANLKDFFRKYH